MAAAALLLGVAEEAVLLDVSQVLLTTQPKR